MVRKMGYDSKTLLKNKYFVIKLGLSFLLVGLAFRLLYGRSYDFSPVSGAPFLQDNQISAHHTISVDSLEDPDLIPTQESLAESIIYREGYCNLFSGEWIPYRTEPLYTYKTCSFIEAHQNCEKNGRPDSNDLYWSWKPHACELPRLDPNRFLEFMRNKSWAFIGDSISRNHAQSFLCVLSTVVNLFEDQTTDNAHT